MENKFINALMPGKFVKLSEGHMPVQLLQVQVGKVRSTAYRFAFSLEPRTTMKSYLGLVSLTGNCATFDFDGPSALEDVRLFVQEVCEGQCRVWYSGSKGFHVDIPLNHATFGPSTELPKKIKWIAAKLKKKYQSIDLSVFHANGKLRLEGSMHEKTNLYKTLLTNEQLALDIKSIKLLAENPSDLEGFSFDLAGDVSAKMLAYLVGHNEPVNRSYVVDGDDLEIYESFSGKKCMNALLASSIPKGERNEVALRLCSDLKGSGVTVAEAQKKMKKWAVRSANDEESFVDEIEAMVTRIFREDSTYRYGCHDDYKRVRCSAKCEIYPRLHPEFRPTVGFEELKADRPTETDVVATVLERYRGAIGHYNDSLFMKTDGVFTEVDTNRKHTLQLEMRELFRNKAVSSQLDSCYRQLVMASPIFPSNPFEQNPLIVGLENGVLCFSDDGTFNLCPYTDMPPIFSKLPIAWEERPQSNDKFLEYLSGLFAGEVDQEQKLKAVQQLFGACLITNWPHLYMFYGPAQTGKSTLLKLLMKFVDAKNTCAIEPHLLEGFMLEAAIGKRANIVTDIDIFKPMNESVLKRIEDRVPMLINRKGRPAVSATLPLIHVFAANAVPRASDTMSGAHARRWTFIEMKNRISDTERERDFIEEIWCAGSAHILRYAAEGAASLFASRGQFCNPVSSQNAVKAWQSDSMIVGKYIEDLRASDNAILYIKLNPGAEAKKADVYASIREWCCEVNIRETVTDIQILRQLRVLGFRESRKADAHYFVGFENINKPRY